MGHLRTDDSPIEFRGTGAGKEFEGVVLHRLKQEASRGLCDAGRYGVQASVKGRLENGDVVAQLMSSLPDVEGALPPYGRQFVFDCKVMSGPSMDMNRYRSSTRGAKRRQLTHMYARSRVGACAFFLIHMNQRELATKTEVWRTVALPVCDNNMWEEFETGEWTNLSRSRIIEAGYTVTWTCSKRERVLRPDVLSVIHQMQEDRFGSN